MRTIKDSPKYEAWLLAAEYLRWVRRGGEKIGLDWSMSATDQDTILDIASEARPARRGGRFASGPGGSTDPSP